MLEKILVAVDGSDSSLNALEKAKILGNQYNSKIYVLSVVPEFSVLGNNVQSTNRGKDIEKALMDANNDLLEEINEKLNDYENDYQIDHNLGNPAKEIVRYAEDNNVNLIVLGNSGLGAFSRTMLGSVSNKIVNTSSISVLVVKNNLD